MYIGSNIYIRGYNVATPNLTLQVLHTKGCDNTIIYYAL